MYKVAKIHISGINNMDQLTGYLGALINNGQILDNYIVVKVDDYFIATVTTTDDDSLEEKYNNVYVKKYLQDLNVKYELIGDDALANDSCHCKESSWYMLYADCTEASSPIICGDCGKEIALIHIPYIYDEEEHYSVLSWQRTYHSVDLLWMDSLSDRFTKNQIINPNSQINKSGIEICSELSKKLNKPVYLYIRNPIGGIYRSQTNMNLERCPKCGGDFTPSKRKKSVDKVCNECKLAFDDID